MDEQNGDCFEHHEGLFAPLSGSDNEHDCLKDFLLDPPRQEQHSISTGYCYDNGLQSLQPNSSLMSMSMQMGGPGMHISSSGMSMGGMSLSQNMPMTSMQMPNSLSLGPQMNCNVPMSTNVGMPMHSGLIMSMPGSLGLPMSQNTCMPLSPSTNLSIPNQGLPMSPSSLSRSSSSGMSPSIPLPMSTGSHTMPSCSPISMTSNHSLPMNSSNRPFMDHMSPLPLSNLPSCMNESPTIMHRAYQTSTHVPQLQSPISNQTLHSPVQSQVPLHSPIQSHIPLQSPVNSQVLHSPIPSQPTLQSPAPSHASLKSPVQSQTPANVMNFRSPGHSVDSVVQSALDNGVLSIEGSEKNGEWSPAGTGDSVRTGESQEDAEPGTSERTVSSDCVSSETLCSPETEGAADPVTDDRRKKETRGRKKRTVKPPRVRKSPTTIATYQSQISPDQNGIKIRIKKSLTLAPKKTRKRRSKQKEDDYEEPAEQSAWGERMPKETLSHIFYMVTKIEGCVPFLVRMSRVCRLWRDVSLSPHLWYHIDLASTWCRDRVKNDRTFQWLCENRLAQVQELNLGGWSFTGIPSVLGKMATSCVKLQGLGLSGLQGLSLENVKFLVSNCPYLERLDLSSINPELNNPRSAVSTASLLYLAQTMGERLTHLILANNKLAGVPQIITAISTYCPNLQVLDLANVRTVAQTTAYVHIEKLQEGCPSLRVLRLTNSQLALSPVSFNEQATSQGFPHLEELSVAGVVEGLSSQPFIDDEALQRIIKASKKLRLLDVRGCNKVSDSSLVRIPAWDLEHIFLSGCFVTRLNDSGLELIVKKWSHSLVEVDLAWSTATEPLDAAVQALAEQGETSRLRTLDLCGSSVSLPPVKAVLTKCPLLSSINLSSCRALPRGMKRLYQGLPLVQLRSSLLNPPSDADNA